VRRALACLAALAAFAGCGGGGDKSSTAPTSTAAQSGKQSQPTRTEAAAPTPSGGSAFDPDAIYKTEAPSVVTLFALQGGAGNSLGRQSQAVGSGFVVDDDGHIATNAHVITTASGAKARQVFAQFADGNRLPAKIVGADPTRMSAS
jgi:S1-C subfamily serine protease